MLDVYGSQAVVRPLLADKESPDCIRPRLQSTIGGDYETRILSEEGATQLEEHGFLDRHVHLPRGHVKQIGFDGCWVETAQRLISSSCKTEERHS